MDLEVVGRHALLFDDDAMASFVNSTAALVDWNSLSIDRYDVRHLLSGPPPPRKRRRHASSPPLTADDSLEAELDRERYLDLPPPSPSPSDQQDADNDEEPVTAAAVYNAVPFSYGNTGESNEQKDTDSESSFLPPFPVPESLLQSLPPTEKVHQIMARTAMFVSRHGGQSEIVLRVKQGDNPTFGFLMPDHPLHPYFRFLVDHQELLSSNSVDEESKADSTSDQVGSVRGGGALSLLGTVYGSGEDEEGVMEDATEVKTKESVQPVASINKAATTEPEQKSSTLSVNGKDETGKKDSTPSKEKASLIKRNPAMKTVKAGTATGVKKESDASAAEKLQASSLTSTSKVELPVVEPPSELKRVVDKIVEFILKNGRQFEAVLVEQDVRHGRFPFLLSSNLYHPYYLKVLQKAEKSKLPGKGSISDKHDSSSLGVEKKAAQSRESDSVSVGSDIPYDSDRKEKFKMVINKSKKDGQDPPSKANQPQVGVSVDAAAAILQAARRGSKKPNLEILSKTSLNGNSQSLSSEGGHAPNSGSLSLSQPQSSIQKPGQKGEPSLSGPVANAIAKTAAIATASEADSSEAGLTKEEKLKAERLKRAKMFAAMIKSGAAPLKTELSRGLSAEPPESGISGSGVEGGSLLGKEREGSSVPLDVNTSDKTEQHDKIYSGDHTERRSKRKYRSRSSRHEEDSRHEEEEDEEEEKEKDHKHSGKKRRSHHSSHHRDRHKHRRKHSSSKDRDSRHRHKHDSSSDDERGHKLDYSDSDRHHSRHRRKRDSSSEGEHKPSRSGYEHSDSSEDDHRRSRHRHGHDSSSDDEDRGSRHRHKHHRSSNDEFRHQRKRSHSKREGELEEGEICAKSDQSKLSEGNGVSRETSVDVSKEADAKGRDQSLPTGTPAVSDDLRAKIRAMLMATL